VIPACVGTTRWVEQGDILGKVNRLSSNLHQLFERNFFTKNRRVMRAAHRNWGSGKKQRLRVSRDFAEIFPADFQAVART
jgi:hypothetical protein